MARGADAGSRERGRRLASIVLVVFGTVFLFIGGLTLYLREEVFDAAARAHRSVFSRDRDQLVLNLADTGAFVIDAVKAISPNTAKRIPKDIKPGLIEVT